MPALSRTRTARLRNHCLIALVRRAQRSFCARIACAHHSGCDQAIDNEVIASDGQQIRFLRVFRPALLNTALDQSDPRRKSSV